MIEPGTPIWKGGNNPRSSTIDLVITSDEVKVSMVEIAAYLFTGSDHKMLCWKFDDKAGSNLETHKRTSPR
jgi:hypothetical protein